MKAKDVDQKKLKKGLYCQKGFPGCFCAVGYPYEYMCPLCRDYRDLRDNMDYCLCTDEIDRLREEDLMGKKKWNDLFLARIHELIAVVKDQWGDLGSWRGLGSIIQNIKIFKDILEAVVLAVEQTWIEFDEFPKEEKLDYAAKVLDNLIPLPGILEWFDQKIFKLILSLAVVWINDRYSHNWKPITSVKFGLVGPGSNVA